MKQTENRNVCDSPSVISICETCCKTIRNTGKYIHLFGRYIPNDLDKLTKTFSDNIICIYAIPIFVRLPKIEIHSVW